MLSVDGQEVARNSMEHTTPVTFPEDETFDVGQDTRTGVAMLEYRYDTSVQVHRQDQQADVQARTGAVQHTDALTASGHCEPVASEDEHDAMTNVLLLAAVSEAATGVALLIVPSLVGQLLFGAGTDRHCHDRGARDRHRPDRIGGRLLAGHAAGRHVDLQRGRHAVSRLRRLRGRFDRHTAVAGGRPARDPDGRFG